MANKSKLEQIMTTLTEDLETDQEEIAGIKEMDNNLNKYLSQLTSSTNTCRKFHLVRLEKLHQIEISTKKLLEASKDKLESWKQIEGLRKIGGFDQTIMESLVNVEFFMSKLDEDDIQDRLLKEDYAGPVFLQLNNDDMELEDHFWEQIKPIVTNLMFTQHSSVQTFFARFRGIFI